MEFFSQELLFSLALQRDKLHVNEIPSQNPHILSCLLPDIKVAPFSSTTCISKLKMHKPILHFLGVTMINFKRPMLSNKNSKDTGATLFIFLFRTKLELWPKLGLVLIWVGPTKN